VLFIFTDDQREDTIGALGNPHIQTPHLDELAHNGVVFTNAYCMGGFSPAVCAPSRIFSPTPAKKDITLRIVLNLHAATSVRNLIRPACWKGTRPRLRWA
jgi:hypothetical protein